MTPTTIVAADGSTTAAEARLRFWENDGASTAEANELVAYTDTRIEPAALHRPIECPLADEPFVATWRRYAAEAAEAGTAACLRRRLMQLRFPVAPGTSTTSAYTMAVRRGEWPDSSLAGLQFAAPETLRIVIHPTAVGHVPVIVAGDRRDFVSLVQALSRRNEPDPVPDSMGACILAGYNNWDRVDGLRQGWLATSPTDRSPAAWSAAFAAIAADKPSYQDRFIVLSSGPYSGVPGSAVGCDADEWLKLSLTIRLEHECAHYVTRRLFGVMRTAMLDEVIADFIGIVAATGTYRADWFLRFVGLDCESGCRADGRLHNYRGTPALSDGAFARLQGVLRRAAAALERFYRYQAWRSSLVDHARWIVTLLEVGLEGLAADDAQFRMARAYQNARRTVGRVAIGASPAAD